MICFELQLFFLLLAVLMLIIAIPLVVIGCDSTLFCPLYSLKDVRVTGFHTDKRSCYVRQTRSDVDCYSLFVSYVFDGGRCENYPQLFSYKPSTDNYGFTINQTREIYVSKTDGTCGLAKGAAGFSLVGFVFMVIALVIISMVSCVSAYHDIRLRLAKPITISRPVVIVKTGRHRNVTFV